MSKSATTILLLVLAPLAALTATPALAATSGPVHGLAAGPHHAAAPAPRTGAAPQSFICTEDEFTMCLNGGRFEVTAQFSALNGESGAAHMVRLTDDSGYMWFFASSNIEVVAKVLNGCGLNDEYWFFAGGLTNVDVLITVTDSITEQFVQYHNPQNTAFQPIQDTSALAVCP